MSPRRVLLMAHKEALHVLRDLRTVYLALGIPLLLLLLFGYALTMDVEDIEMLLIDQDHSQASIDFGASLQRSRAFTVVGRPADSSSAAAAFKRGQATVAVVIPRGFGKSLDRGEEASAQILVDGTNANDASIALGFAAAAAQIVSGEYTKKSLARLGVASKEAGGSPIQVQTRAWFNQSLRSKWYLVPGLIAVILAMITTLLMALTVAREWERGTMEQLLITPVKRSEIVLGKLLPYFAIGLCQLVLVSAAGIWLFGVPLKGSLALLFGASSLLILGGLGQGLLISVVTRNQQVAMQVAMISSMLPALLLSGFMSPISSMPWLIQKLTVIIPARYALVVMRGIFLKGLEAGAMAAELGALALFAIVFFVLSIKRFKTRLG